MGITISQINDQILFDISLQLMFFSSTEFRKLSIRFNSFLLTSLTFSQLFWSPLYYIITFSVGSSGISLELLSWRFATWTRFCKPTIIHISFHVRQRTTRKVLLLFFGTFLLVLTKFSFWQGKWALGYHFMKCRHFPNISWFPKSLSLQWFGNSWGNPSIPCL